MSVSVPTTWATPCYLSRGSSFVVPSLIGSNVTATHRHDNMLLPPSSQSHQSHGKPGRHCDHRAVWAAEVALHVPSATAIQGLSYSYNHVISVSFLCFIKKDYVVSVSTQSWLHLEHGWVRTWAFILGISSLEAELQHTVIKLDNDIHLWTDPILRG